MYEDAIFALIIMGLCLQMLRNLLAIHLSWCCVTNLLTMIAVMVDFVTLYLLRHIKALIA